MNKVTDDRCRLALHLGQAGETNLLPVLPNRPHNVERKRKRPSSILKRHHRRVALPHRMQKRFLFRVQRLFGSHRWLAHFNLRVHGW